MDSPQDYIIAIRYKRGESAQSLAKEFGVSEKDVIRLYEKLTSEIREQRNVYHKPQEQSELIVS